MSNNISTDDVVRMAIEDLFPDQTVPDENNQISKGVQHKAPDHSILGGKVLIERKSRNTEDNSQFYYKLAEIAKNQGRPIYGVGSFNLAHAISELPDPVSATKQMTDFAMRQVMKSVGKARKKFEDYAKHVTRDSINILIISDNTAIKSSTAPEEYYLGRKMGAFGYDEDETGVIHSIIIVKDPEYVLDEENSYWFKCIIKKSLTEDNKLVVNRISSALHYRISHYQPYFNALRTIKNREFRLTIA